MSRIRLTRLSVLLGFVALASPVSLANAQDPSGPPQGQAFNDAREAMWWAPTADDWKKPCLVTWQRTWDDAVEVSQKTGKAILVCINMDGEIASEHYAGVRYRMPEIATIYEPYVTVIASVYRHTPRDYDQEGQRILCPRFGSVTCGEHIAIEPVLYEQFMEGQRIAPRHIMVELDGAETYDVFYAFDTDSVFQAIREGITNRENVPVPLDDVGEPTLAQRVASPDVDDRTAVETEYVRGDRTVRRKLVRASIEAGEDAPVDLLRLAVFDLDVELNRMAREALAQATTESSIGLINEALRAPMDPEEREMLIAALERLGQTHPRARTLAAVHRGLAAHSDAIDVDGWSRAVAGAQYPAPAEAGEVRFALEYQLTEKAHTSKTQPEDPGALLDFAAAQLALAIDPETAISLAADPKTQSKYSSLMFEDVKRSALRAEELGSSGWRLDAVIALAAYYEGDLEVAHARAEAAVDGLPAGEESWNAMAVLALYAQSRTQAIKGAVRAKQEWPKEYLTDVNAAYSVLARHPLGTDYQVAAHNDFLRWMGAFAQAELVLDQGLARFPDSPELHARLRARTLWQKGVGSLESVYEKMLAEDGASPNLEWFAGYASLVAAEYYRRAAEDQEALDAYGRGIVHYEHAIEANEENRDSADHYIAMAIAGRARIAMQREEYEVSLAEIKASFARKPDAAATLDGLGFSAVATATTLRARLREQGREDLVAELQAALDSLDPVLLEPPAFERQGPGGQQQSRRRGQRRQRQGG